LRVPGTGSVAVSLINATSDCRRHLMDEVTYQRRLDGRWNHRAPPEGRPDAERSPALPTPGGGTMADVAR